MICWAIWSVVGIGGCRARHQRFHANDPNGFETHYYVGLDPKDALRQPTKKLTIRTMRQIPLFVLSVDHNRAALKR